MVNCHAADGASYHNVHSAVVPTPQAGSIYSVAQKVSHYHESSL